MNNSSRVILRKICKEFAKELDEMKTLRVKLGIDDIKSIKADWRLTLAIIRHPTFKKIKEDVINADLP